ncbi:MAG: lysozyme inhibitor LprI family protein [Candidatus Thiothrix sulfatifontis]|nr:MAG: lysozyme inhibitor LprI family protein [Candidatus Thiothrix sulfatifontis]
MDNAIFIYFQKDKLMKKIHLIAILTLLLSENLFAAGFDCNKAETQVEKMICADSSISELDDRLNSLYEDAKSSQNKKEIITKIKDWLKLERNQCQTEICLRNAYEDILPKLELLVEENTEKKASNKTESIAKNDVKEISIDATTIPSIGDKNDIKENNNTSNSETQNKTLNKNKESENQILDQKDLINDKEEHPETTPDNKPKSDDYTPWWIAAFGSIGVWFWNKFIRNRCPNCNSTNFSQNSGDEIDRWRQSVKVTETLSNGKSREKHVTKTFIKVQYTYKCRDCGRVWSMTKEREK